MSRKLICNRFTACAAAASLVALGGLATAASASTPTITSLGSATGPLSGGAGVVTVTGTHLDEVRKVWFGDNAAAGLVHDGATTLYVTPPAGAPGTVDVTFGAAPGAKTSDTVDDYTYTAAPVIETVTAVGLNGSPKKDHLAIKGSQLKGATLVVVGDVPVKVDTKVLNASITDTVTVKAPSLKGGSYTVTVVTPQGVGSIANGYGASPVVSKLYVPVGPAQKAVTGADDAGGTLVHVAGTGFTGLTSFGFGAASTTDFVVVSDTLAKVVVPAKAAGDTYLAGTHTLKVKLSASNRFGTYSKDGAFRYDAAPKVTGASAQGSFATSDTHTVTLTGSHLKGAKVLFGSAAGAVDASSTDDSLKVRVPKRGTQGPSVDVTLITAGGTTKLAFRWTFSTVRAADVPWSAVSTSTSSPSPSAAPSSEPTAQPSAEPSSEPTAQPSAEPSTEPTAVPTP